jgi:hypothetical protein
LRAIWQFEIAEHTHFFRQQEKLSLRKQQDNAQSQRRDAAKRRTSSGLPKRTNGSKTPKVSPPRTTTKQQHKRIGPEDPCPFHVGHK